MKKDPSLDIYLIRHGETDWNLQGRMQGQTDISLNPNGITQALQLGDALKEIPFSHAYSSDLSRASHTAELILKPRKIPLLTSSALRERSAGALEGEKIKEIDQKIRPFFLSEKAMNKESYLKTAWHPEIETSHSVFERVKNFLAFAAEESTGQPILVVSHGGVLRSFLDHLSFVPLRRWVVANCGYIQIRIDHQAIHLIDSVGVKTVPQL